MRRPRPCADDVGGPPARRNVPPFARRWQETLIVETVVSARLALRILSVCDALGRVQLALGGGFKILELAAFASLGYREGHAAVKRARGRLHHRARLDRSDRILDYEFVASTEWNFHTDGPLAATLGGEPRFEVQRVARVFGSCVAFEVELKETVDA